ncbi:MAG TPA: low molecular weight protein-tyrosine-phosphatase [Kineosporiaceae bacterium]|nr:low molecular weight protein-tyrosine-phosphatase [Kineosporiaceae bacterium]
MDSAYRICFVCTGNICRSPSAEVIVRALAERAGILGVQLDSAGTGDWHVGQPADPRALIALTAAGYDGRAHRARGFAREWFGERELIVALDRGHARLLRSWAPDAQARSRIRLLRSFDPAVRVDENHRLIDVADPYYDGAAAFTEMVEQIEAAGAGLLAWTGSRPAQLS